MLRDRSRAWKTFASALACAAVIVCPARAFAQARGFRSGGGGLSTSRVVSPAVVATWRAHDNYADDSTTTLLVLWRGTPGWFVGGRGSGSGGGGGAGRSGSFAY